MFLDKIRRKRQVKKQDITKPKTIDDLIRKYDLENIDIYNYLDYMVELLNNKDDFKVSASQPNSNENVWFKKGKNELDTTNLIAQTFNGVTISRNSDGTITLNGTVTSGGGITILNGINKLIKGTNTFSARIVSGTLSGGAIRISINDNTDTGPTSTTARIFSTTLNASTSINSNTIENLNKTMFYLSMYINPGITFTNCKIALQVEAGSAYSNYQNYIDKVIYVKNDNDIFEEYVNVERNDTSYSLELSKLLASGTDLNNLTQPGVYYSENATKSASLVNSPVTDSALKIIVEQTTARNRFRQTIYKNDSASSTYVRTYAPSGFGPWKQVGVLSVVTGTATTNEGGSFSSGISRNHDIVSAVVMKASGGNWTKADVYVRNDQANQVIYVRDVSNNAVANTEVEYRIKYIEN